MTAPLHGGICHRLSVALDRFAQQGTFPHAIVQNTLFDLTPPGEQDRTVLAPAVAIMRGTQEPATIPREAPWIACEVVSPNQVIAVLRAKARFYLDAGTAEVWIIDPTTRTAMVVTPSGEETLDVTQTITSALLPGFVLPISWLLDGVTRP